MQVGWIFTDLVSEDTRKGTVRYSRNKVRNKAALAGVSAQPILAFRPNYLPHSVPGKLRLGCWFCPIEQSPLTLTNQRTLAVSPRGGSPEPPALPVVRVYVRALTAGAAAVCFSVVPWHMAV